MTTNPSAPTAQRAVLDPEHVGDIRGAFGTIGQHEEGHRGLRSRTLALLAIVGPGLIVMVGDNDAGASPPTRRPVRTTAPACSGCCCCWSRC